MNWREIIKDIMRRKGITASSLEYDLDISKALSFEKSYDFTGLEDDTMLDAAMVAYGGDEVLREKVVIRRQLLPLMEMLFLIDRKDEEGIVQCAGRMRNNLRVTIYHFILNFRKTSIAYLKNLFYLY